MLKLIKMHLDTASSFNENFSQSKLSSSYSQSSFDSNQSLIGSTSNAHDLDNYFASRFGAPPESDIEVLSNPSISSIEVLERFSRQSSRKQSDDLRSLLQTQLYVQHQQHFNRSNDGSESPSLDMLIKSTSNSDIEEILDEPHTIDAEIEHITITQTDGDDGKMIASNDEDAVNEMLLKPRKPILTGMNLTESSSSGSVTDSVCTAYENQSETPKVNEQSTSVLSSTMTPIEQDSIKEKAADEKELESTKIEEASTVSNMLGGKFSNFSYITFPNKHCKHFSFFFHISRRFIQFNESLDVTQCKN